NPVTAHIEVAFTNFQSDLHAIDLRWRAGGTVTPAAQVEEVGAAERGDVAEHPAGRERQLHLYRAEDVPRIEVAVRPRGGQVDADDPYLMEGAADDADRAGLPRDQLVFPLLLVERPMGGFRQQRGVGAEPETVEQVRADGAVGEQREV